MNRTERCVLRRLLISSLIISAVYTTVMVHAFITEVSWCASQIAAASIVEDMSCPEPAPVELPVAMKYTAESVEAAYLAKTVYGEARGIQSITEQAGVCWCILNRVDGGYGGITEVVTSGAFYGYNKNNPTIDGYGRDLCELAADVLNRWDKGSIGRVLPDDYYWFTGDGKHNYFRNKFDSRNYWDWSLPSPYES